MTPFGLGLVICALAVVRAALSLKTALAPNAGGGSAASRVVREYLDSFIVACLVALFIVTLVMRPFFIPSLSMVPTLRVHDVLMVNELEYKLGKPHNGDVVVFTPPIPTTSDFIKRLIAGPGDTLRIQDGIVYRNGAAIVEPYINDRPNYDLQVEDYRIFVNGQPMDTSQGNIPPPEKWTSPDTIPPNCYFMMGDNRNDSEDSHMWGFAQASGTFATGPEAGKRAGFTGHATLLFWPPTRIGPLH